MKLERYSFFWQKNRIGISNKIYLYIRIISSIWKKEKHSSNDIVLSYLRFASFILNKGNLILVTLGSSIFAFFIKFKFDISKFPEDFDFCFIVFLSIFSFKSIPNLIWTSTCSPNPIGKGNCKTNCSKNFSMGIILLSFVFTQYNKWIVFNILRNSLEKGIKLAKHIILGIKFFFKFGLVLDIAVSLLSSIFNW